MASEDAPQTKSPVDVWLDETLHSVLDQTFTGSLELSFYDDASTVSLYIRLTDQPCFSGRVEEKFFTTQPEKYGWLDSSLDVVKRWCPRLEARGIHVMIGHAKSETTSPRGPGYGRNQAIGQSRGKFLCILDADDVMAPERIAVQHIAAMSNPDALVGCRFSRLPEGSTERYTRWANSLTPSQLYTQAFTAFGPTIIQPTWFCTRELFDRIGPFSEAGKGTPEDLLLFYKHLSQGGWLLRVEETLLMYRYHLTATSFSVDRWTIWRLRVDAIQDAVLQQWTHFTIWNAGKQGRRLYRALRPENRAKVVAFCDVDPKKIAQGYYTDEESQEVPKPKVPIVPFTDAKPPFVLCVKWDLTDGGFETNLRSMNLQEGRDYYHFS